MARWRVIRLAVTTVLHKRQAAVAKHMDNGHLYTVPIPYCIVIVFRWSPGPPDSVQHRLDRKRHTQAVMTNKTDRYFVYCPLKKLPTSQHVT